MVDRIIAELPQKPTEALLRFRRNAAEAIKSNSSVASAPLLKSAIDEELMRRFPIPDDGWSNGTQGDPRFLRAAGKVRAMVIRLETHGASKGEYLIEVLGEIQPEQPRHIEEARAIAERRLENLKPEIANDFDD